MICSIVSWLINCRWRSVKSSDCYVCWNVTGVVKEGHRFPVKARSPLIMSCDNCFFPRMNYKDVIHFWLRWLIELTVFYIWHEGTNLSVVWIMMVKLITNRMFHNLGKFVILLLKFCCCRKRIFRSNNNKITSSCFKYACTGEEEDAGAKFFF